MESEEDPADGVEHQEEHLQAVVVEEEEEEKVEEVDKEQEQEQEVQVRSVVKRSINSSTFQAAGEDKAVEVEEAPVDGVEVRTEDRLEDPEDGEEVLEDLKEVKEDGEDKVSGICETIASLIFYQNA